VGPSAETPLIFKSLRIGGTDYDVELHRSLRELFIGDRESHEKRQFRVVELYTRRSRELGVQPRRIWWMATPSPGKGVVEGDPVFAICAVSRDGDPMLVLAMANTYYPWSVMFLIDPARDVSQIPDRITSADETRGDGRVKFAAAESQLERIEVPTDLRGIMYGTRTVDLEPSGEAIVLRIQRADNAVVRLRFALREKLWEKLPSE
jgi:hypothetical protein